MRRCVVGVTARLVGLPLVISSLRTASGPMPRARAIWEEERPSLRRASLSCVGVMLHEPEGMR